MNVGAKIDRACILLESSEAEEQTNYVVSDIARNQWGIFFAHTFTVQRLHVNVNWDGLGAPFVCAGRQFDKNGNLQQWWSDDVIARFKSRAQCMIDQYGNYTIPEVGLNVRVLAVTKISLLLKQKTRRHLSGHKRRTKFCEYICCRFAAEWETHTRRKHCRQRGSETSLQGENVAHDHSRQHQNQTEINLFDRSYFRHTGVQIVG